MLYRAKWFGEVKGQHLRFDQFDILAWVTSGSKKAGCHLCCQHQKANIALEFTTNSSEEKGGPSFMPWFQCRSEYKPLFESEPDFYLATTD